MAAWKITGYVIRDSYGVEHRVVIFRNGEVVGYWQNVESDEPGRTRDMVLYAKDGEVHRFAVYKANLIPRDQVVLGGEDYKAALAFPVNGTVIEGATVEFR